MSSLSKALTLTVVAIACSIMPNTTHAQYDAVPIGVAMPVDVGELTSEQAHRLESKLTNILSKGGEGGAGLSYNGLVCIPRVSIGREEEFDNGLSLNKLVSLEITLTIMHLLDGSVLESMEKKLTGTSSTTDKAIDNALNKLYSGDTIISRLFARAREKYVRMYESRCASILKNIESKKAAKRYEEALVLAMSVPDAASGCYGKAAEMAASIYKSISAQECKRHVMVAITLSANRSYTEALDQLAKVDPSSTCFDEAKRLATSIGANLDSEAKKQWEDMQARRSSDVELEKAKIDAMKEIVVSYYKGQQSTFNLIVK